MKVVFADFDGVFHPSTEILGKDLGTLAMCGSKAILDTGLFRWTSALEEALVQSDDSHIALVVHSSWRNMSWATSSLVRELLGPLGHRFEGFVQRHIPRETAILEFVARTGLDDFLILDDAGSEFKVLRDHLVLTNPLLGTSERTITAQVSTWASRSHETKLCLPVP